MSPVFDDDNRTNDAVPPSQRALIMDLEKLDEHLAGWEIDTIEDLSVQIGKGVPLTQQQFSEGKMILDRINRVIAQREGE